MTTSIAAERSDDELTIPAQWLRASILFDQVEVLPDRRVCLTFTVQPIPKLPTDALNTPYYRSPDYRSIRIVLPEAQALSMKAALDATIVGDLFGQTVVL